MRKKSLASAGRFHSYAVRFIGAFTIVALALFCTSRASAYTPNIGGVYALGNAQNPDLPEAILSNPAVDGIALRFFWDQLEPSEAAYDWSLMDRQVDSARAHGKKVSLSVTPGVHTPAWVYAAGAAPFTYTWNRPFGFAPCSQQRIPIPWDSVYLAKWSAFVRAMGRRYASNPAVVMVKITGINSGAAEMNLPHGGGMSPMNCPGGSDDDANWRRVGYSKDKIKAAFQASGDAFAAAFPNQALAVGMTPVGFPLLDNEGANGGGYGQGGGGFRQGGGGYGQGGGGYGQGGGGYGQGGGGFGQGGGGFGQGGGGFGQGGGGFGGGGGMFGMRRFGQGGGGQGGGGGFGRGGLRGDIRLSQELMEEGASRYGDRYVLMTGGLSAFNAWTPRGDLAGRVKFGDQMLSSVSHDPQCHMNRGMTPCDPHEVLQAAVNRGIDSGALFLEIYTDDIQNPRLQDILQQGHARLAPGGSRPAPAF